METETAMFALQSVNALLFIFLVTFSKSQHSADLENIDLQLLNDLANLFPAYTRSILKSLCTHYTMIQETMVIDNAHFTVKMHLDKNMKILKVPAFTFSKGRSSVKYLLKHK